MQVDYLFTDRKGGVSAPPFSSFNLGGRVGDEPDAVATNRHRLRQLIDVQQVVFMQQVHSADVQVVDPATAPQLPATDGIVTTTPGLALAVLAADCMPIVAMDVDGGVVAAAHAGRVGAAGGIAVRMLHVMVGEGARLDRIRVILGPAICGGCYEVPAAMRDEVDSRLPGSASVTRLGTPGLDLRAGLDRQLRGAGVRTVEHDPRCTLEDVELFSHRRGAPTGRQAGVVWLT